VKEYTLKIGKVFESMQIYGNFGVDFLATSHGELFALEINLRITGTTHPNMTMRLLIKGNYAEESGLYQSKSGSKKFYIASDNIVDGLWFFLSF
jgi:predicted ATP-grasp superfamily ATP-dependent carboligase